MPTRVCILDDYQQVAFKYADWTPLGDRVTVDVFTETIADEARLAERLKDYQIVCAMRERTVFPSTLLDKLPKLKLLATTGARNAGIDVKYAKSKGIVVSGTSSKGNSTLEHIWALILSTVRHVAHDDRTTKEGNALWQTKIPFGLSGRTLGLVGAGKLGSQTGTIARAFGMRVVAWSPNLTPDRASSAGVEFIASKEELFRISDIVSVHMVLSDRTRRMITAADLGNMKPTAFFINTSRGPLVDEEALIKALREGRIAGAGLDVFDIEPLPSEHPLRSVANVTLTPHMGYVADSNYECFWGDTVDNIVAFLDGCPKRVMD